MVGVSFHVGSGCQNTSWYALTLRDYKHLFEMAEREFGYKMTILDIGGGFPGETYSRWNLTKVRSSESELPLLDSPHTFVFLLLLCVLRALLCNVAAQAFGNPTAKEREPLKKVVVLADIPSISKGDKVAINNKEEEEDLDNEGLEGKEPDKERPL